MNCKVIIIYLLAGKYAVMRLIPMSVSLLLVLILQPTAGLEGRDNLNGISLEGVKICSIFG